MHEIKKLFFMIMKLIYLMQFLIKEMILKSEKILKGFSPFMYYFNFIT